MKTPKNLDLTLISIVSLLAICMAIWGEMESGAYESMPGWFLPLGILLLFVFPGYTLTIGLLPPMSGGVTLLLTLGLSICVDIVGGLILNVLPGGLRVTSWTFWLAGITLLGCAIGFFRRFAHPLPEAARNIRLLPNIQGVLALLLAILISVVSIDANLTSARQSQSGFTQLWAVPVSSNEAPFAMEVGIQSQEMETKEYNVYVESAGKRIAAWSGVEIDPEKSWTTQLTFSKFPQRSVNVFVYLSETPNVVYRTVKIAPEAFLKGSTTSGTP